MTKDTQGAMTVAEFCKRYSVGRTKTYEEIGAGRLHAVKLGTKTLIRVRDAEAWNNNLPAMKAAA